MQDQEIAVKRTEIQTLCQKISEMQMEQEEHQMVLQTLKPMEAERPCYRLINGVLIERTVQEIIPVLEAQLANISKLLQTMEAKKVQLEEEMMKIH